MSMVGGDWLDSDHVNSESSPHILRPPHDRLTDFLISPNKNIVMSYYL